MNKEFGHKIHDQGGSISYNITTFSYVAHKSMIKKIEGKGIKYVLLSVVDHDHVIRETVDFSNKELIGFQF
jgi:hypothetical protein